MKIINQKISVAYEYNVIFTHNIFSSENIALADVLRSAHSHEPSKVLFVLEKNLVALNPQIKEDIKSYSKQYSSLIEKYILSEIQGGENLKSEKAMSGLCALLYEHNLCRHSFVVIIGGGAFLDAVGFAASIVHRGIRQIRVPSTVLAQDDSGVGVKTAINMYNVKNYLGTFAPPFAVINDLEFLKTLSYRDWVAGIPEAFKVAMIKDANFFIWLCNNVEKLKNRDLKIMEELITQCATLHLDHIATSGDPFEFGSARPLDFGHWSAHKLEMLSHEHLRHGEAVALGLLLGSFYAVEKDLISLDVFNDLYKALKFLKIPVWSDFLLPNSNGEYLLLDGIEEFREHLGGELHITLPSKLGNKIEVSTMDDLIIIKAINHLHSIR